MTKAIPPIRPIATRLILIEAQSSLPSGLAMILIIRQQEEMKDLIPKYTPFDEIKIIDILTFFSYNLLKYILFISLN